MRLYNVRPEGTALNWTDIFEQALEAYGEHSNLYVEGRHETVPVSFCLQVGRLALGRSVHDARELEISGMAEEGTDLATPSPYIAKYTEGTEHIRLQIDTS